MASSEINTLESEVQIKRTMPDDGTFLFPSILNGGIGKLVIGADEERTDFTIKSDGTVNLLMASLNIVTNADTDGKFCIETSVANPLTIKNRLGSAKVVTGSVWYG